MSDHSFGEVYASFYDVLYQEKDYQQECDLIDQYFKKYSQREVKKVVDLGCGTGGHSLPLARMCYQVLGVDRSAGMLEAARQKVVPTPSSEDPQFVQADIRSFKSVEKFDAAVMLFAVLGYQYTNQDVIAALRAARGLLHPGGVFIFDVWFGPAVIAIQPSDRVKLIETEAGNILRTASGSLDVMHHLAEVNFHIWHFQDGAVKQEVQETHKMRFFFPMELHALMEMSGLRLLDLFDFNHPDSPPGLDTWNIIGIAEAIG